MPTIDWRHELIDQLEFAWDRQFLPRIAGLTDTEYLWQPVPDCWTIRPDSSGRWVVDFELPEPSPPPVTTIAWRIVHLMDVFGDRDSHQFGDGSYRFEAIDLPETADAAISLLTAFKTSWVAHLRTLDEVDLARRSGESEGSYSEFPLATLILHVNREFIHHAAEIQLLRDLYLRQG